jgi:Flp pilus assembly pilin Flp
MRWGRRGQSTAEYIIIVALVAIGSIAIITVFGNQIRALFTTAVRVMSGNNTPANDVPEQGTSVGIDEL